MKLLEFAINYSQTAACKQEALDAIRDAKSFVAVTFDENRILHYHPFNIRHDQAIFAMEFAKQHVWDEIYGEEDEDN